MRVYLFLSPLLTPPSTLAAGRGTCSPCHGPAQLPWCFPAHLCRVCVRATYLHSERMLRVAANSPNKHQSQACLNIAPHGTPFIPTHSLVIGVKITSPLEMGPRRWCCPPGCVLSQRSPRLCEHPGEERLPQTQGMGLAQDQRVVLRIF